MKKIIMLVLIGCLVFTLAACTVPERDVRDADDSVVLDDGDDHGYELIENEIFDSELVFNKICYTKTLEEESEHRLNDAQIEELNKIFKKYTWEAAVVPECGFENYTYQISQNDQLVAFFVIYEEKTLVGVKDADGATDGIYLAPIGLFQDIANFYSANL